MKNLMLFVHPSRDFLKEHKTSIKIQIDNSLELGWKREDIILATNFPYEYNGVKSLLVSDDNYCAFSSTLALINVIVELFEREFIEKGEVYWYHDEDAYQLYDITDTELDLGEADMAIVDMGTKSKLNASLIFFKSSAKDIFGWIKETAYKYQINEEDALMALYTNNLLWVTDTEANARQKFVPFNIPGTENLPERIKTLNLSYNFEIESLDQIYEKAAKPIKVVHFHFSSDLLLDSFLYGKNSLKIVFAPERLIKIFHKHGVAGIFPKKMKNLMIYLNPEKKFLDKTERLVKAQIDNSLKLGWKKQDLVFLTNFPYEYQGIKATVLDDSIFDNIIDKAYKSNAIFHLLTQGVVKEGELWWCHDLDVFQLRPINGSEIDLEGTAAGFTDTGSIFFRKGPHPYQKIFEWMRNRACKLNTDEATALMSLSATNYRNINSMYKKLKLVKMFKKHKIKGF